VTCRRQRIRRHRRGLLISPRRRPCDPATQRAGQRSGTCIPRQSPRSRQEFAVFGGTRPTSYGLHYGVRHSGWRPLLTESAAMKTVEPRRTPRGAEGERELEPRMTRITRMEAGRGASGQKRTVGLFDCSARRSCQRSAKRKADGRSLAPRRRDAEGCGRSRTAHGGLCGSARDSGDRRAEPDLPGCPRPVDLPFDRHRCQKGRCGCAVVAEDDLLHLDRSKLDAQNVEMPRFATQAAEDVGGRRR